MKPAGSGERGRSTTRSDLAVMQTCIASYRDEFVRLLVQQRPGVQIYAGREYFDPTITLSAGVEEHVRPLVNHFFMRRRLLWQSGALAAGRDVGTAVLELNPRILSTWLLIVVRRLRGHRYRTYLWGHAWPRAGMSARSTGLRLLMMRLSTGVVLYTENDRRELLSRLQRPMTVAHNSVVSRTQVELLPGRQVDTVQIGRLVEAKRPELTLDAWAKAVPELPAEAKLVFVGDGPLKDHLERRSRELGVHQRVEFIGSRFDAETLQLIFAEALVSVSAGYAGLSLTHSFAYGVPAIIADEEPHAPEISVAGAGNSIRFEARNVDALRAAILRMYENADKWRSRRQRISADVLAHYSVEAMVEGFLAVEDVS